MTITSHGYCEVVGCKLLAGHSGPCYFPASTSLPFKLTVKVEPEAGQEAPFPSATAQVLQALVEDRLKIATHHKIKYQLGFEAVLAELAMLRLEKAIEYGESRYETRDAEFDHWMLFSDVHRKYIRLRQQMRNKNIPGMIESYTDIANYAAMAVQLLKKEQLNEKV